MFTSHKPKEPCSGPGSFTPGSQGLGFVPSLKILSYKNSHQDCWVISPARDTARNTPASKFDLYQVKSITLLIVLLPKKLKAIFLPVILLGQTISTLTYTNTHLLTEEKQHKKERNQSLSFMMGLSVHPLFRISEMLLTVCLKSPRH